MEKVNLFVSKLFLAVHRSSKWITVPPAGLDCLVCRFYWSTGAAEGLIMKDSGTNLRGEVSKKVFFCVIAVVGKLLTLTEQKELEVLPSLDHSLAHVRSPCRWVRAHCHGLEREEEQSRKSGRRNLLKWTSFVCLFFRSTARRWPVRNELFFINGVVDQWYLKRTLLDHYISHFLCEVPCLFFGGLFVFSVLPHWFSKKVGRET